MKKISTYIKEHKEFEKKSMEVFEKNDKLIKAWRAIPWWKFWAKSSFEEQRQIIIDNWRQFNQNNREI